MKATNFDIRISKEAALDLIRPAYYLESGKQSLKDELGIEIMCKEYGDCTDNNWTGIESDDYEIIKSDSEYQTFEIWLSEEQKSKHL